MGTMINRKSQISLVKSKESYRIYVNNITDNETCELIHFNPPWEFNYYWNDHFNLWEAYCKDLGTIVSDSTEDLLCEAVIQEISFLWHQYAIKEDNELREDIGLKYSMLYRSLSRIV